MVRAFKNKWFNRWAKGEGISDDLLQKIADEVADGNVDACLGGCLFKKRLARPGGGKSRGYRVLLGYRRPGGNRIIFLYGFAKSARANISGNEAAALSMAADAFLSASEAQIQRLVAEEKLWEVLIHE